jgi:hypothetical protein
MFTGLWVGIENWFNKGDFSILFLAKTSGEEIKVPMISIKDIKNKDIKNVNFSIYLIQSFLSLIRKPSIITIKNIIIH